jgi:hypothetical protein
MENSSVFISHFLSFVIARNSSIPSAPSSQVKTVSQRSSALSCSPSIRRPFLSGVSTRNGANSPNCPSFYDCELLECTAAGRPSAVAGDGRSPCDGFRVVSPLMSWICLMCQVKTDGFEGNMRLWIVQVGGRFCNIEIVELKSGNEKRCANNSIDAHYSEEPNEFETNTKPVLCFNSDLISSRHHYGPKAESYDSSGTCNLQSFLNHAFSIIMIRSTLICSVVTQVCHFASSIVLWVSSQPPWIWIPVWWIARGLLSNDLQMWLSKSNIAFCCHF